jgi:hypothetical protein
VATLKYTGPTTVTFGDLTVYHESGKPITVRVGEVRPDQEFSVPDDAAEPFLRRSDIELVSPPVAVELSDAAPVKPARGKTTTAE